MEGLNEHRVQEHAPVPTPEIGEGVSEHPELGAERQEPSIEAKNRPVVAETGFPEVGGAVSRPQEGSEPSGVRSTNVDPEVSRDTLNRFITDIVHGNREVDVSNVSEVQAALLEHPGSEE